MPSHPVNIQERKGPLQGVVLFSILNLMNAFFVLQILRTELHEKFCNKHDTLTEMCGQMTSATCEKLAFRTLVIANAIFNQTRGNDNSWSILEHQCTI